MTGYASRSAEMAPFSWSWDLKSVNGRGLDLRLRVPDWISGLEPALRARLAQALSRGSVSVSLRITREEAAAGAALDQGQLDAVLDLLARVSARAEAKGVALAPPGALDLAGYRGVLKGGDAEGVPDALLPALLADFEPLLAEFLATRASEGAAIGATLAGQIDAVEAHVAKARAAAGARGNAAREKIARVLGLVLEQAEGIDPGRLEQELALLAVKADVAEELDRLDAHVAAARALLAQPGPIGRKFDFLTQEFNREANTLCAKSNDTALTRIGLDLKAVIDQMREQVQNAE